MTLPVSEQLAQQSRRGRLALSMPDLGRLLGMPDDVEITGVDQMDGFDVVLVTYRGPRVPLVDPYIEPRAVLVDVHNGDHHGYYAEFVAEFSPTPEESDV